MTCLTSMLAAGDALQHVLPHSLFPNSQWVFLQHFTNHTLMMVISAVIMVIVLPLAARNYPLVPTGLRGVFEAALDFVRTGIAQPMLKEHTDRLMPFIWTLTFFILINNVLGLIPLDSFLIVTTGQHGVFGTATAGLSVTVALAAMAFMVTHVMGVTAQYHHQRHHHSPPIAGIMAMVLYLRSLVPPVPGVIGVLLFPLLMVLEVLTAVVRAVALAIRLFANMMGGHTVLATLILLIPAIHGAGDVAIAAPTLLGSIAISCLEVLVAFLQTYIFVFLTCLFIGMAIHPEH